MLSLWAVVRPLTLTERIMKKVFVFAALAIMMAGCTAESDTLFEEPQVETRMQYDAETMRCITSVYEFCVLFYELPESLTFNAPTTEQMLDVIRYCDLQDEGGDVFPEWDEYDKIKTILWPNGYGKEL